MHLSIKETKHLLAAAGILSPGSLIITGVPGIGKKSIVAEIDACFPDLKPLVSHTDRKRRYDEQDGLEHHFQSPIGFDQSRLIRETMYCIGDDRYALSYEEMEAVIRSPHPGLFVTPSARSASALKEWFKEQALLIRIDASYDHSYNTLKQRYIERPDWDKQVNYRIAFGEEQNNYFTDNPGIVDYTLKLHKGMSPSEAGLLVYSFVNSFVPAA